MSLVLCYLSVTGELVSLSHIKQIEWDINERKKSKLSNRIQNIVKEYLQWGSHINTKKHNQKSALLTLTKQKVVTKLHKHIHNRNIKQFLREKGWKKKDIKIIKSKYFQSLHIPHSVWSEIEISNDFTSQNLNESILF